MGIQENFENVFASRFDIALKEKQLLLYLQPRYNTEDNLLCGAEVLVRWQHPELGLLEPKDFLPQCREGRLMEKLDFYVWDHSCQILQKWGQDKECALSVKISRDSLYNPKTVDRILGLVEKHKISKDFLHFEIEEDSVKEDVIKAKDAINYLHKQGFTIMLDDFSYGSSSVSVLNQIDVDVLKVDMKFFSGCNHVSKGEVLLSSIIKSANWLGMSVLAECVETEQQNEFAHASGCRFKQGFFYCKPLETSAFYKEYYGIVKKIKMSKRPTTIQMPKHNLTILAIDDSEIERVSLDAYLKDDFHMITCENAEKGLDVLKKNKNKIDLVLIDYMLPGMNGLQFLKLCQMEDALKRIPKIMITSSEDAADQVKAFEAGAFDYLLKPLIPELVKVRIRHAMELVDKIESFEYEKQEYKHQAEIDVATGLFNKISFQHYVDNFLSQETEDEGALLIIDIDNFKTINDTKGHLVGDDVIKLVANILGSAFRNTDIVGRFGGDEFTVFMAGIKSKFIAEKKAVEIIEKIKKEANKKLGFSVGGSIGIGYSKANDTFESVFGKADSALYEAKKTGKGKFAVL